MRFPQVRGSNLSRRKLTLPDDLGGELNLVLVPFQQWQQSIVDTWIPFAKQLEQRFPGVRYYELPTIRKMNRFARTFINEGMRAGILDPLARERTVTLYLDKRNFRHALDIPHEESVYAFLVDRKGGIYWRSEGTFSAQKGKALVEAIDCFNDR